MKNDLNQSKVPFISKLAYGMGDVGCNFSWMFVGNFPDDILYRCFWNQYECRSYIDVIFPFLGCHQRPDYWRAKR